MPPRGPGWVAAHGASAAFIDTHAGVAATNSRGLAEVQQAIDFQVRAFVDAWSEVVVPGLPGPCGLPDVVEEFERAVRILAHGFLAQVAAKAAAEVADMKRGR